MGKKRMPTEEDIQELIHGVQYKPSTTAQLWSEIYGSRLSEENKAASAAKEAAYKAELKREQARQYLAKEKARRDAELDNWNGSYLL